MNDTKYEQHVQKISALREAIQGKETLLRMYEETGRDPEYVKGLHVRLRKLRVRLWAMKPVGEPAL